LKDYFTKMCSGSKAGSYLRRIHFVYHSTLGLRVIKKKRRRIENVKYFPSHAHRAYAPNVDPCSGD